MICKIVKQKISEITDVFLNFSFTAYLIHFTMSLHIVEEVQNHLVHSEPLKIFV